jgi:hypothetical protein
MTDYSFVAEQIRCAVWEASSAISAPHAIMKPQVFPDGDMWCALYGRDLQEGVAGFGATPGEACIDFDKNWYGQKLRQRAVQASESK